MSEQQTERRADRPGSRWSFDVNPTVFWISVAVVVVFSAYAAIFTDAAGDAFGVLFEFATTTAAWYYILIVTGFLIFAIYLGFSRFGRIRLGGDDSRPDYSNFAWFAMLFGAGMGIGLVFWGVAEPVFHFQAPPGVEPGTVDAAERAMSLTFFHWGLHPWAIYIVVALSLAYFGYRHDLPLTIRSAFYPILKERIHGPIGDLVDILAVFATIFGVATSLGLGALQMGAGVEHLTGIANVEGTQIAIIAVVTAIAVVSVALGVDRGIWRLSILNIYTAGALLLFVVIFGPTLFILNSVVDNTGRYFGDLLSLTLWADAAGGAEFQAAWTVFYWAWWISWAPFVGMFIARISRGRTIREFIWTVLLAPVAVTFVWFSVFGGTALNDELNLGGAGGIAAAVGENFDVALFFLLDTMPLATITAVLAIIVIAIFFVTSSDSASLVIDILTSKGRFEGPVPQRVFWATAEGVVAAVLLLAGGLLALQTGAIVSALPFSVVMLFMVYGVLKALRADYRITFEPVIPERRGPPPPDAQAEAAEVLPGSPAETPAGAPRPGGGPPSG
jgi:choline/glycine/proline betaine transport protein